MSSFKRRVTTATAPSGSKLSPFNSLPLLSTGLLALDDLLGGGLPLSSSLLLESDEHTAYAELLLKFWIAQGLECKQEVIVVGNELDELVRTLMGVEGGESAESEDEASAAGSASSEKLKIAFRYEGMKQHADSVPQMDHRSLDSDTYCSMFDLTTIMPLRASDRNRLHLVDLEALSHSHPSVDPYELLFDRLTELIIPRHYLLPQDPSKPRSALRIALHSLGSPAWGHASPSTLFRFLHRLRTLLRNSSASAVVTFPAYLYTTISPSFVRRMEYAADGVIELSSFAGSPARLAAFPKHSGLLRIPSLPSIGSLVPPSAKLSVLRGLGGGGQGESSGLDLGFRIKRRRFIIEPLRDDSGIEAVIPIKAEVPAVATKKAVSIADAKEKDETNELRSSKVRFAAEGRVEPTTIRRKAVVLPSKPASISSMLHKSPELYEF